ncbi:hypothetical protein BC643_4315 [Mangrovibacterium diazotrophicum]|uniref:DUF5808 domain-containing protein n=1 Tax=Mangrovibacterium diazotrophicum TaxID=1261403 RepID=A0A419VV19_9BACT|nr:hypothetical protein BC643_4315 [Mangrovibacterium diazotrophicum]
MKSSIWKDPLIKDKKDSRLLIPRPYPRDGWTLNFGQPLTWVFLVAIVGVVIFCIVFS